MILNLDGAMSSKANEELDLLDAGLNCFDSQDDILLATLLLQLFDKLVLGYPKVNSHKSFELLMVVYSCSTVGYLGGCSSRFLGAMCDSIS